MPDATVPKLIRLIHSAFTIWSDDKRRSKKGDDLVIKRSTKSEQLEKRFHSSADGKLKQIKTGYGDRLSNEASYYIAVNI